MRHLRFAALLLLLLFSAALVEAAGKPPQTLPPGMGRYILVLKVVGERRDSPKTITEPDVAKLGGKVLSKHDNRRVIELPAAAAKNLRENENVAYLQRVWMGEPLDTWDERDRTSGSALKAHTDDVTGTNLTWNSGNFGYDPSGNIKAIGNDTYGYDTSSRLVKAVVNGTTETYGYDSFGNLTQKTISGQSSTIPAIDSTSNRISGEAYDAAGNVTTNGSRIKYVFDSAGSMAELDTQFSQQRRMIYTADDERIGEMLDSELIRWKIRDFNSGQILREFQSGSSLFGGEWEWTEDYIYAGKTVVGAETEEFWGGKRHFHLDHLGSVRMITNDARLRYSRNDYYPFGTEQSSAVQEAANFGFWRSDPAKFTGHERDFYGILNVDNTDYLDYMHARFYNPNMGRFLSVDRDRLWHTDRPESWNRYMYARDNPLTRIDPDGLRDVYVAIWEAKAPYIIGNGSVGHAAAFETSGKAIMSQFPEPHGMKGKNTRLNYQDTVEKEGGRLPDSVYKVFVRDDAAFDKTAADKVNAKFWYVQPVYNDETNCVDAVAKALNAGGVPIDQGMANVNLADTFVPGQLEEVLDNLAGVPGSGVEFVSPTTIENAQPTGEKDKKEESDKTSYWRNQRVNIDWSKVE